MIKDWDVSYPRECAERKVGANPGALSLDELARRVSLANAEEPVSVRDIHARPIRHSKVYLRGEEQPWEPHLVARLGRKGVQS